MFYVLFSVRNCLRDFLALLHLCIAMADCINFFDISRGAVVVNPRTLASAASTSCAENNGAMASSGNSDTRYENFSLDLTLAPSWLQKRQGTVIRPIPAYAAQKYRAAPACQTSSDMVTTDAQKFLSVKREVSTADFLVSSSSSSVSMSVDNRTLGSFSVPPRVDFSSQKMDSEYKAMKTTACAISYSSENVNASRKESHCMQDEKLAASSNSHEQVMSRNDTSSSKKQENVNVRSTCVSSVSGSCDPNLHACAAAPASKTEDLNCRGFPEKQLSRSASVQHVRGTEPEFEVRKSSTGQVDSIQLQRVFSGLEEEHASSCSFQQQHEHMDQTLELQRRKVIQTQRRQEARKRRKLILEERQQKKARETCAYNQKSANQSGKTLTEKINRNFMQVVCNTGETNVERRNIESPATTGFRNRKPDNSRCDVQHLRSYPDDNIANGDKTEENKSPVNSQCSEVESCETKEDRINGKGNSSENESSNQNIAKEVSQGPSESCFKTVPDGSIPNGMAAFPPFPFFPVPYPMVALRPAPPMHLPQGFPVPYFLLPYVTAANTAVTAMPSSNSLVFVPYSAKPTGCISQSSDISNAEPIKGKMKEKECSTLQKSSTKKIKHRKSKQASGQEKTQRQTAISSHDLRSQVVEACSDSMSIGEKNIKHQNSRCALDNSIGQAPYIGLNSKRTENPSVMIAAKTDVQKQRSDGGSSESQIASEHSMPEASSAQSGTLSLNGCYPGMLWVSTAGQGPDGKRITGLMYIAENTHVCLVCSCHGEQMSPAQFVAHSGSSDLSNPEKNIVVSPFPLEIR